MKKKLMRSFNVKKNAPNRTLLTLFTFERYNLIKHTCNKMGKVTLFLYRRLHDCMTKLYCTILVLHILCIILFTVSPRINVHALIFVNALSFRKHVHALIL